MASPIQLLPPSNRGSSGATLNPLEASISNLSIASSSGNSGSVVSSSDADISTTLYLGNLHPFAQQRSLEDLCAYFGPIESSKFIQDKSTGTSAGYGFVKFVEKLHAEAALQALNGKDYLGQELRVNWALPNNHKEDTSHHCHIFVGDLGSEVTDAVLYNTFCTVGQCSDARVMWDHSTGWSKGYGFVSFRKREDAERAISEMQNRQVGSRRIRVGWAQHKQDDNAAPPDYDAIDKADPANTNVYIGNIAPETSESDLTDHFMTYGSVADVKLHKKGGYGFVRFEVHESAVKAIVAQHGQRLHDRVLKCSWGKNVAPSRRSASLATPSALSNLAAMIQSAQAPPAACATGMGNNSSADMMAALAACQQQQQQQAFGNATMHSSMAMGGAPRGCRMVHPSVDSLPPLYNHLLDLPSAALATQHNQHQQRFPVGRHPLPHSNAHQHFGHSMLQHQQLQQQQQHKNGAPQHQPDPGMVGGQGMDPAVRALATQMMMMMMQSQDTQGVQAALAALDTGGGSAYQAHAGLPSSNPNATHARDMSACSGLSSGMQTGGQMFM